MSLNLGIIIGGLLPAFFFGVGIVFQKASNNIGIAQGHYLLWFAIGTILIAAISFIYFGDRAVTLKSGAYAAGHGIFIGLGFLCLAIGMVTYQVPVAKLAPLANMSTLVAVILGFIVFSEWQEVNIPKVVIGTLMIIAGGLLVSN